MQYHNINVRTSNVSYMQLFGLDTYVGTKLAYPVS